MGLADASDPGAPSQESLVFFFKPQVFSRDKEFEVGRISKQWTGLVKEVFTDADNFGVACECWSFHHMRSKFAPAASAGQLSERAVCAPQSRWTWT